MGRSTPSTEGSLTYPPIPIGDGPPPYAGKGGGNGSPLGDPTPSLRARAGARGKGGRMGYGPQRGLSHPTGRGEGPLRLGRREPEGPDLRSVGGLGTACPPKEGSLLPRLVPHCAYTCQVPRCVHHVVLRTTDDGRTVSVLTRHDARYAPSTGSSRASSLRDDALTVAIFDGHRLALHETFVTAPGHRSQPSRRDGGDATSHRRHPFPWETSQRHRPSPASPGTQGSAQLRWARSSTVAPPRSVGPTSRRLRRGTRRMCGHWSCSVPKGPSTSRRPSSPPGTAPTGRRRPSRSTAKLWGQASNGSTRSCVA